MSTGTEFWIFLVRFYRKEFYFSRDLNAGYKRK